MIARLRECLPQSFGPSTCSLFRALIDRIAAKAVGWGLGGDASRSVLDGGVG